MENSKIAIIGASGSIGSALVEQLAHTSSNKVYAFSRSATSFIQPNVYVSAIDYDNETSIAQASDFATTTGPLDLVVVATGLLHDHNIRPEKSLRDLSQASLEQVFFVNTIAPTLVAKHFLPTLNMSKRVTFAVLSARVGSIEDNRLGGWYAYRASKAALNMMIKTASIEMARKNKETLVIGLHPGTVKSELSAPYSKRVPDNKLFAPQFSAARLIQVMSELTPEYSGRVLAWDGGVVPY